MLLILNILLCYCIKPLLLCINIPIMCTYLHKCSFMQNMLSFNLIYNSALFECIRDN